MRITLSALLLVIAATGCSGESAPIEDDPPPTFNRSAKRGLAFNLTDEADILALREGVSWWYNWYYTTSAPADYHDDHGLEFIPMLWGRNAAADFDRVRTFILGHPEIRYLLVMNEPNLLDQANLTPTRAASDWVAYEALLDELAAGGRDIELVGPAITWGTMPNFADPVVWMDAFYDAYRTANGGTDPRIDYLAFHWYDYGLEAQLDRLAKYGKEIWVTEMANWNANIDSYEKHAQQMIDMVALCESRADVFRYAWFIGRGDFPDSRHTYLLNVTPGTLTSLGELYLTLPYAN